MECSACKLIFSGEGSFKKHRTGSYGLGVTSSNGVTRYTKHERRCLTWEELKEKGLSLNDKGLWTTNTGDEEVVEVQESEEVEA
jgi:hypothetical protein